MVWNKAVWGLDGGRQNWTSKGRCWKNDHFLSFGLLAFLLSCLNLYFEPHPICQWGRWNHSRTVTFHSVSISQFVLWGFSLTYCSTAFLPLSLLSSPAIPSCVVQHTRPCFFSGIYPSYHLHNSIYLFFPPLLFLALSRSCPFLSCWHDIFLSDHLLSQWSSLFPCSLPWWTDEGCQL